MGKRDEIKARTDYIVRMVEAANPDITEAYGHARVDKLVRLTLRLDETTVRDVAGSQR